MSRKKITDSTIADVLVASRRRCCICFGLSRDSSIKQGQIAHIDGDSENPNFDNLAFLCFDHHDRLDSHTSQSKNFTVPEVKKYREELYNEIVHTFSRRVMLSEPGKENTEILIQGHYIRDGLNDSAEIKIQHLSGNKFYVEGQALWGTSREYGPNIGTLEFEAESNDYTLTFTDGAREKAYSVIICYRNGKLEVEEEGISGYCGMNVTFAGTYSKAA